MWLSNWMGIHQPCKEWKNSRFSKPLSCTSCYLIFFYTYHAIWIELWKQNQNRCFLQYMIMQVQCFANHGSGNWITKVYNYESLHTVLSKRKRKESLDTTLPWTLHQVEMEIPQAALHLQVSAPASDPTSLWNLSSLAMKNCAVWSDTSCATVDESGRHPTT
jgi:hypothetical protein